MLIWTLLKVAFRSLFGNKLRSFLAMLGIIIGVGAVISMLALGAGAESQVMERMTAMGTNLLIVRPGASQRGGIRAEEGKRSLVMDDANEILRKIEGVESVAPLLRGRAQVSYYNKNTNTTICGTSISYLKIRNFELEKGRAFSDVEEEQSGRVAILGFTTAQELFEGREPIGERIRVKNVNFRVIGVLKGRGDQGWFNPDDMVVIPYSTAMKQILGKQFLEEIDVKVADGHDLGKVEKKLVELLRQQHRIPPEGDDDFNVRNQAELLEMASSFTQMFTILMGGIAGISLIVGGIGIMNIMLVTVTERTREIGVRKAIGARNRDILRQFLLESILISGLGGLVGIGVGMAVAEAISHFSEYRTVVQTSSVVLSLAVSASVGIFFGYYPARRAAHLHPIEALRYE